MSNPEDRRQFLAKGAGAASVFVAGAALVCAQEPHPDHPADGKSVKPPHVGLEGHKPPENDQEHAYPRNHPGIGGPVGSPTDRGKLVPGLRNSTLPPIPVQAPDLKTLPWKFVNDAKEFQLVAEPVRRELLPGKFMDTYGFNGDIPGPTIEINQGDRVRILFHNNLPEPTSMHWHGLEVPNEMDGVPWLVQDLIQPGENFIYEFTVHQEGTYFYHTHVGMQEALGMVGLFIVHPLRVHEPIVDRDFGLIAQAFQLRPNSTVPDTLAMEWNFLTFNGRSGPLTTPLLCKLGERVRIRFLNFSVMDHHPLHLHGHTFWITGTEGGRMPEPAWYPSNNVLVAVAQVRVVEFIANNPGDWIMHCHMFHHMMNSMTSQAGPLVRNNSTPQQLKVPGYPQIMLGMEMTDMDMPDMDKEMPGMKMKNMPKDKTSDKTNEKPQHEKMPHNHVSNDMAMAGMARVEGRQEAIGMRPGWSMGVEGLSTVVRVLIADKYDEIMGDKGHEDHKMHQHGK